MSEYSEQIKKNRTLQQIEKKIADKKANQRDLATLAAEAGKIMGKVLAGQLQKTYPDGKMSQEDIRSVVSPVMRENHKYISEMAAEVQNIAFEAAGVGLKAVIPDYDIDRENNMVTEIYRRSNRNGSSIRK